MSSSENLHAIIRGLMETNRELRATNAALIEGLMEVVRRQASDQASLHQDQAELREAWRDRKRRQRSDVPQMSRKCPGDVPGTSGGQMVDSPGDIPPDGFSPGTPVSLTPSKEPPTGSRKVPVLQETLALKDGKERGFSETETNRHLAAFKNYGDKVGWRSKAGPWRDYNAAFRQWLGNETPSVERPLKVVY